MPTLDELTDVAALGPEPSAEYRECVDALDNAVREAIHVSHGYKGIPSPSTKHFYASVLYTALISRSVSLAQLVPFSPWAEKPIEHWDYSSATGIARTALEIRLAFYYLCVDACTDAEWDCRWNLFNLHDCTSRLRLFEAMPDHGEQVAAFSETSEEVRQRLRANAFFNNLDDGRQRRLLNGQTAFLMPLEEIGERAGLARASFRWMYIFFSSHVHALPMSFYRMGGQDDQRGNGLPSPIEEGYTCLCLSLVTSLLVSVREEMNVLFAEFKARADEIRQQAADSRAADDKQNEEISSDLELGEVRRINETEDGTLDVKRVSETGYEFEFRERATGELVLRRHVSEQGEGLSDIDPFFWTILVNQRPAVEKHLIDMHEQPHAFKVDLVARTILFKTA